MKISLILCAWLVAGSAMASDFGKIESSVEGKASLNPAAGAVFVQFVGSPSITDVLRGDLVRSGFSVATNKSDAKQLLIVRGAVVVKSSNGKATHSDLASIAEGERLPLPPLKKEEPAPAQIPEGHYAVGGAAKAVVSPGLSVLSGTPVNFDFADQGRSYRKKLAAEGIGTDPATCSHEKCSHQILSQQVAIAVEVSRGKKSENARIIASMQGEFLNLDMLTARAMYLAIAMVKGAK